MIHQPFKCKSETTIIIPEALPSWNDFYAGKHWAVRKKMADHWHELAWLEARKQLGPRKPFKGIVAIMVSVRKPRPSDPDNVCAKLIIDGLKGFLLQDDTSEYIAFVCTDTMKAKEPETIVTILEL